MDLEPYIIKQKLLQQYRVNLHSLELRIASDGGFLHTSISTQNQYTATQENIARLEEQILQIQSMMTENIPAIRERFKEKEEIVRKLESRISLMVTVIALYEDLDQSIIDLEQLRIDNLMKMEISRLQQHIEFTRKAIKGFKILPDFEG